MKLSRFKPFFIGVGILSLATLVVIGLGLAKPENEKEETKKPPLVVRTANAELKEQTVFSTFQGEVRAKTNIELVTQVTGKVTWVSDKFIEGGQFEAGETLVQIDDSDYQVALKSAEASVAAAQVELEVERATAANRVREWQDLQGKPIEQANPLVLNKPQIDRAKARLSAAQAELAAAKLNYDRTKISAPFAGRIMTKAAELGQFMSRGTSVGRVFATDAMEVRIPMTDVQISELGLRLGYSSQQAVGSGIAANVSAVFGDEIRSWPAYVKSVDASVDNQTRLLYATVVVEEPFSQSTGGVPLVPGLFVDVEMASPEKIVGLELPRTALRNGNQVYAYHSDELKLKPVKVIYTSLDRVIVALETSEIEMGEQIITSSVPGAYEGMPVKLPKAENLAATEKRSDDVTTDVEALIKPAAELGDAELNEEIVGEPDAEAGDESGAVAAPSDSDTGLSENAESADLTARQG